MLHTATNKIGLEAGNEAASQLHTQASFVSALLFILKKVWMTLWFSFISRKPLRS